MPLFGRRRNRPQPGQIVIDPQDPALRHAVKLAILGSAYDATTEEGKALAGIVQPYQLEALGYRATLGEIRYAADFYARPLRRLKLYVGEEDAEGEIVPTKNPKAIAILKQIHDPGSQGRQALITEYGRLMFCTGEGLLTYTPDQLEKTPPRPEAWEMLSQAELRPDAEGAWQRYRNGRTQDVESLPADARVYRMWQRDTMYSDLADAPMRAVLDLCEELAILTLVVRARAISRLAGNGILFIPDNITVVAPRLPDGSPQPAENAKGDPLLNALVKAILAPIEDQGAASSVAPLLLRGAAEAGEQIRHITVRDVSETFPEIELRKQTIERLAISLDMPKEGLEGIGNVNHWGGWQVERDTWRHVEPVANQMVEDLTTAVLRPSLVEEGVANPERFVVMYDASEILTNPDRGEDAKTAYTLGTIGPKAYRKAMGWDDDDAPSPDEVALMLLFLGKGQPSADAGAPVDTAPPADDTPNDAPADDSQGDGQEAPASTNGTASQERRVWALQAFADAMVVRHREIAGVRVKGKTKDIDVLKLIEGLTNDMIPAAVGHEPEMKFEDVVQLVACRGSLMEIGALKHGLTGQQAKVLASFVESHAARTLWQATPPSFPESSIRAVIE